MSFNSARSELSKTFRFYKLVKTFLESKEATQQEYKQYCVPVITFFDRIFKYFETDYERRHLVYQFLESKENPIEYLCRSYLANPNKADYEAEAQKIVDDVILTMEGKKDSIYFSRKIGDKLTFYMEFDPNEKESYYSCYYDSVTGRTLLYDLNADYVSDGLLAEIAMFSYLCKQEWYKSDE